MKNLRDVGGKTPPWEPRLFLYLICLKLYHNLLFFSLITMKFLILDESPTWTEAYCRKMGSPLPQRKRWKTVSISELQQCLKNR